jgi:hypothetical protein
MLGRRFNEGTSGALKSLDTWNAIVASPIACKITHLEGLAHKGTDFTGELKIGTYWQNVNCQYSGGYQRGPKTSPPQTPEDIWHKEKRYITRQHWWYRLTVP